MPSRRLSPKERVLKKYPKARLCIKCWGGIREINDGRAYVAIGLNTELGSGTTPRAAWADAARRIARKD